MYKYLLEFDGELTLPYLSNYIITYINLEPESAQDDGILFYLVVNSLSSEVK